MPFRAGPIYLTAEDLEEERKQLQAYTQRKSSHNLFKRFWWWITRADNAYFQRNRNV